MTISYRVKRAAPGGHRVRGVWVVIRQGRRRSNQCRRVDYLSRLNLCHPWRPYPRATICAVSLLNWRLYCCRQHRRHRSPLVESSVAPADVAATVVVDGDGRRRCRVANRLVGGSGDVTRRDERVDDRRPACPWAGHKGRVSHLVSRDANQTIRYCCSHRDGHSSRLTDSSDPCHRSSPDQSLWHLCRVEQSEINGITN